ncbi:hypothetical protein PGQ11_009342 [Apiospora arundinis]|uniref:Uncharacterized protein n=1 Tax=Apiospora arundinis TaxID=335852 RepID=A0ABR2IHR1_9PEZI
MSPLIQSRNVKSRLPALQATRFLSHCKPPYTEHCQLQRDANHYGPTTAAAIAQDLYPEIPDHLFLQLLPFLPEIKPIDALSSTVLHHRYFCYNLVDGSIGRDESIEPVAAPTFVRACDIRIDLRRIAGPPRPTGFRDLHLYKSWMRPLRVLREAPVP